YHEMAYGLQRQRWANAVAPQQGARVQRVRALSNPGSALMTVSATVGPRLAVTPVSLQPQNDPTAFGGRHFWDAVTGGNQSVVEVGAQVSTQWRVNEARGQTVDRMEAVAALQALNALDDHQSAVNDLLNDTRTRNCLEMAQLQLYQCMSAAR